MIKKQIMMVIAVGVFTLSILSINSTQTQAVTEETQTPFLIYQLQTGSSSSASSELVSVVNISAKPQRLNGLCVFYSAATSENWLQRACFEDPDAYTQFWIVADAAAYIASDEFIAENPEFLRDLSLSGAMSGSGGAIRLEKDGVVLDVLGWGNSNFSEGSPTLAPATNELLQRDVDSSTLKDTGGNSEDFVFVAQGIIAQSGVFEVELPRDICTNIDGIQEDVPLGYERVGDECYEDVCLNIDGVQQTTEGYTIPEEGVCEIVELEDSTLIITELLPNVSGVDDGNEFIEISNPNTEVVDLAGYTINAGSKSYVFGSGLLGASEFMTISDTESGIVLPNTTGVEVVLIAPSGREVSRSEAYNNAPDDQSWMLLDGVWQFSNQPTPGEENKNSIVVAVGGEQSVSELAPCPEGKFRNPLTNRCKNIVEGSSLVPCDADEFRNPLTNRCNKVNASSSSLTPCRADQERNPETNRCRKIQTASEFAPCPEGKERNPETNRCRNVAVLGSTTGSGGSALTAEIVDVPAPSTGVNWALISATIIGSLCYILYEWRGELRKAVASVRRYRYN